MSILIVTALLGVGVYAMWHYVQGAPTLRARRYRRNLMLLAAVGFMLLLAMIPRAATLLPLLGGVLALALRFAPLLTARNGRWQPPNPDDEADAHLSRVQTRYLEMTLDRVSGRINGRIKTGRLAGYLLNDLDLTALQPLYREYSLTDRPSADVLQAYLDRRYGEGQWQEREHQHSSGNRASARSGMTEAEALEILGLAAGCSRQDIIETHRRLIQKLHPDRGGSDYLAAKINQAKDVLLKHGT